MKEEIAGRTVEWGFRDFNPEVLPSECYRGIANDIRNGWTDGTLGYFGAATPGWWRVIN